MNWTYDTDSNERYMVYDFDAPDTAPVICREVRTQAMAKRLSALPEFEAAAAALMRGELQEAIDLARTARDKAGIQGLTRQEPTP